MRPVGDRFLVRREGYIGLEATTLIAPEKANLDTRAEWGQVIDVGAGYVGPEGRVPLAVEKGQYVLFGRHAGRRTKDGLAILNRGEHLGCFPTEDMDWEDVRLPSGKCLIVLDLLSEKEQRYKDAGIDLPDDHAKEHATYRGATVVCSDVGGLVLDSKGRGFMRRPGLQKGWRVWVRDLGHAPWPIFPGMPGEWDGRLKMIHTETPLGEISKEPRKTA